MPPKVRITKDDIISRAVEMVKRDGITSVNARALATELGCSTQPIFSNYRTMDALYRDVIGKAVTVYEGFIEGSLESGEYPPYKAHGMGYIRFAKEERELFKLLFMRDRDGHITDEVSTDEVLSLIESDMGFTRERAELFHLENWIFVHGIASMLASGYLELDDSLVSDMLTDAYLGLRYRFGDKNDG